MRFPFSLAVLVLAVSLVACGEPGDVGEAPGEVAPSTTSATVPSTTSATVAEIVVPTLGVSPDEFREEWNSFFVGVHPHLVIESFVTHGDDPSVRLWSGEGELELTVDPENGELTGATLFGSFGHTDQNIRLAFMWFAFVNAVNKDLNLDDLGAESHDPIAERIGLPPFEGDLPEGFRDPGYRSEGVIDDVLYVFEELERQQYLLTATPAP